jgi:spermidine synthase
LSSPIKFAIWAAVGLFVVGQLFGLVGLARTPLDVILGMASGISLPFFFAHFFLIYAFARPPLKEFLVLLAATVVGAAATYVVVPIPSDPDQRTWHIAFVPVFWLGLGALVALGRRARSADVEKRRIARNALGASLFIAVFGTVGDSYLAVTRRIHPETFDPIAFHFDGSLGFQPSQILGLLAIEYPALRSAMFVGYNFMSWGFAAFYGMQLARRKRISFDLLQAWAVAALFGYIAYHIVPIAGPAYMLGGSFPTAIPALSAIPDVPAVVQAAPRNGFPSMHFGWAFFLWLAAVAQGVAWVRAATAILLGLNILATMGTGEHYLIDLVAAVPAILIVISLCVRTLSWAHPDRRRALVAGTVLFLGWVLAVRHGVRLFESVPGLTWIAIALTVGWSGWCFNRLLASAGSHVEDSGKSSPEPVAAGFEQRAQRYAPFMFFLSGFTGLVYEVLFSKSLALTFGSMATAAYTVLATYMGGMAIGAWLGGKIAAKRSDPLLIYAFCELGIGLYCAATPILFKGIQAAYVIAAAGTPPGSSALLALRVILGGSALLAPTILMGMTLPVLARFFEGQGVSLGRSVAVLYAANTLGAALGALLAGYAILPALGVFKTTLVTAAGSLFVALMAIELHKQWLAAKTGTGYPELAAEPIRALLRADPDDRLLGQVALLSLFVGGGVTLALEVNYIHLLAVVAGNSTYAFSLMLFAFLLGLGIGSEVSRRLLRARVPVPLTFGWLQLALAATVLGGVFLWDGLPQYFASFSYYRNVELGFGAREAVRGAVCWIAMFPPAFVIGALYPLAMELVGRANPDRQIQALGFSAALNTVGNILGVLIAGFVLLPGVGALTSIQLLAATSFLLGVTMLVLAPVRRSVVKWAPVMLVVPLFIAQPRSFDYTQLSSGANVYFAPLGWGRIIDHAESIDGGLTSVATTNLGSTEVLTLLTNGKFQGNNAVQGEMRAQVGFALAPLLHTSRRERGLVIGYGTGVSARTLHAAGFRQLDIVDLSGDIIRLANRHFGTVNDLVTAKSGVETFTTDGRNFLLLQPRKYDVIGLEVSSIWFAGAASLYNREFYRLVKMRLHEHGVLQQWMQLHHLSATDVLYILGSVRAEFRYVWFYMIGGQGIIIASNNPDAAPSEANAEAIERTPDLAALLKVYDGGMRELRGRLVLDPPGIDRLLGGFVIPPEYWVSTDDNLILEYSTPRGNVLDGSASFDHNLNLLKRFAPGT